MLAHGASAYILKATSGEDLATAVCTVRDGDVWLPHALVGASSGLKPDEATVAAQITTLTPQPLRAMAMIGEALLTQQIARQLSVSEATVKAHMTTIMRELGVSNHTRSPWPPASWRSAGKRCRPCRQTRTELPQSVTSRKDTRWQ